MLSVGPRENTRTRRKGMTDPRAPSPTLCVNPCKFVQLPMKPCCLLTDDDSSGCSTSTITLTIPFCREYTRSRSHLSDASTLILISLPRVHQFSSLSSLAHWLAPEHKAEQAGAALTHHIRSTAGTSQPESSILMEILNGTSRHRWNANESIYVSCSYLTPQRLTGH